MKATDPHQQSAHAPITATCPDGGKPRPVMTKPSGTHRGRPTFEHWTAYCTCSADAPLYLGAAAEAEAPLYLGAAAEAEARNWVSRHIKGDDDAT